MWHASKPVLDAFRQRILDDEPGVRRALGRAFVAEFGPVDRHESLKRVPARLSGGSPMADLFRYKDLVFGRRLSDDEVYSPAGHPRRRVQEGHPVFTFLDSLDD